MRIRDAKKEEFNKIWDFIKAESFDLTEQEFAKMINDSLKVVVFDTFEIGFAMVNFIAFEEEMKQYDMCIYIDPKYRRQGYGTLLMKHIEKSINEDERQSIRIENMLKYYDASDFLSKTSYEMWYSSSLMVYSGGLFNNVLSKLVPYEDKYYKEYVELRDDAFYQISIENNMTPNSSSNSTTLRAELMETKDEHSLLVIDNQLIGVVQVTEDHVSRAMVIKSARGKGYGRSLVKYATNRIINSGLVPKLFIMDTNVGARRLYESLGYRLVSTVHVYRKNI